MTAPAPARHYSDVNTRYVRPAAVADAFYPARTSHLKRMLDEIITRARRPGEPLPITPKALVVPHAGYIYSGHFAALAYLRLAAARTNITRVVLLGPSHRVPLRGLALPGWTHFQTPLGDVPVDQGCVAVARWIPYLTEQPPVHEFEHSMEVQLPFLQTVLEDFQIVPIAVGEAAPGDVADVLEEFWYGPETLIVVSTDLSHYLPYAAAQRRDEETVRRILALDPAIEHDRACGASPLNGFLVAAKRHGLQPRLLGQGNSGDTAGESDRVVGYAAIAFEEPPSGGR